MSILLGKSLAHLALATREVTPRGGGFSLTAASIDRDALRIVRGHLDEAVRRFTDGGPAGLEEAEQPLLEARQQLDNLSRGVGRSKASAVRDLRREYQRTLIQLATARIERNQEIAARVREILSSDLFHHADPPTENPNVVPGSTGTTGLSIPDATIDDLRRLAAARLAAPAGSGTPTWRDLLEADVFGNGLYVGARPSTERPVYAALGSPAEPRVYGDATLQLVARDAATLRPLPMAATRAMGLDELAKALAERGWTLNTPTSELPGVLGEGKSVLASRQDGEFEAVWLDTVEDFRRLLAGPSAAPILT